MRKQLYFESVARVVEGTESEVLDDQMFLVRGKNNNDEDLRIWLNDFLQKKTMLRDERSSGMEVFRVFVFISTIQHNTKISHGVSFDHSRERREGFSTPTLS